MHVVDVEVSIGIWPLLLSSFGVIVCDKLFDGLHLRSNGVLQQ